VNYTLDLPRDVVDSVMEKALRVWAEVTPLTFSRLHEGEADIMISFAVRGNEIKYPLIWCFRQFRLLKQNSLDWIIYIQQKFIAQSSTGWEVKMEMPADLVFGKSVL
jgi:hypothetical protein